jgi:ketosteroid isomerase-like protein
VARESSPNEAHGTAAAALEGTIRELDQLDARAVVSQDTEAIDSLLSPDILLHFAPAKRIRRKREIVADPLPGFHYTCFSRTTEEVAVLGDIAITMGGETMIPEGNHPNAGQNLERRFTHVWRNEDGRWRLLVRHASVVGDDFLQWKAWAAKQRANRITKP